MTTSSRLNKPKGLRMTSEAEFKRIADDVGAWIGAYCIRVKRGSARETDILREVKVFGATREILREIMKQLGHVMGIGSDAKGNKITIYHGIQLRPEARRGRSFDQISDAQLFRAWRQHVFKGDIKACAEFLGVGHRTIYNWEAGNTKVQRAVLLLIHELNTLRQVQHAEANLSKPPKWLLRYIEASTSPGASKDEYR